MMDPPRLDSRCSDKGENIERKVHISRIPTKFTEATVERILRNALFSIKSFEDGAADADDTSTPMDMEMTVELVYPRDDDDEDDKNREKGGTNGGGGDIEEDVHHKTFDAANDKTKTTTTIPGEHRGFGFVTFASELWCNRALTHFPTLKGGRKATSTKQHTMYLRPYATTEEDTNRCYLWTQRRCPYGDEGCKFAHSGPGACIEKKADDRGTKKKGKCFAYKKGKCIKGDDCPFSHDFVPTVVAGKVKEDSDDKASTKSKKKESRPTSEKDCINWKTKGKCRKGDVCVYRHDPELLKKAQSKKKKRKQNQEDDEEQEQEEDGKIKERQPLSIRVFGMAYDTTEQDIREFFQECGSIQNITFPIFEDSGRSKGYCGVWFASPKAVAKAVEFDGKELMGRWLSIQAGKMYLKQWEENHQQQYINGSNKRSRTMEAGEAY